MDSAAYTALQQRMTAAFNLVANETDWKKPVLALVSNKMLQAAGLSIEDVAEAVAFFTATVAKVTPAGTSDGPGYFVTAVGYRAGPAGDH